MASKYDKILPKLKPLPPDPSYQDKVQVIKQSILQSGNTINGRTLAAGYTALRAQKDKVQEDMDDIDLLLEAYTQLLADSSESDPEWGTFGASKNTIKLENGDKIEIRKKPYAQVVDKEAVRLWAIKNGYERQLGLPWMTLNSITAERLMAGDAEPDGVECFMKNTIYFTQFKPGE